MEPNHSIIFEPRFGLLVCKIHRCGVDSDQTALKRHLRGDGHFHKGKTLTALVDALLQLSVQTKATLLTVHPPVSKQPVQPVSHLKILPGWTCVLCKGQFLTTSAQVRDRHASAEHSLLPQEHTSEQPLWTACQLQTFFCRTGDVRYFRVQDIAADSGTAQTPVRPSGEPHDVYDQEPSAPIRHFLQQSQLQRIQQAERAVEHAKSIPDSDSSDVGFELWMKKLGVDRYVRGLRKDEMASSYRIACAEDTSALQDLRDVSLALLHETSRWCQHGPEQRMTDPQAARISSFWSAADPEGKAKTFRRKMQATTLKTYLDHWLQMLTWCWRGWQSDLFPVSLQALAAELHERDRQSSADESSSDDLDMDPDSASAYTSDCSSHSNASIDDLAQRYVHISARLRQCLRKFAQAASACDDPEQKVAILADPAIAVSQSLLQQHLRGSPFHSPILAYAAMMAVDPTAGCWTEPGSFNNHLSALVYCGQLWTFRLACNRIDAAGSSPDDHEESDDGLDEELDQHMRKYLTNTVSKPMGYLLLWRRRLFGIAPLTMVNRPSWWNLEKTAVTYRGVTIRMDEVRQLCRRTIDRARDLLFNHLLFGATHLRPISSDQLTENDHQREHGWWFGKHPQNAALLAGHETAMLEHVAHTAELRDLYLMATQDDTRMSTFAWRPQSIRLYRQLDQDYRRALAVAIHISAGPPVRAPEFGKPMWRNTEQLRHMQLCHGKVMIHLTEHKMEATTGRNVNNVRFLCDELSDLVVNYLIYVVPVLESMGWQDDPNFAVSPFFWHGSDGPLWSDAGFSDMLQAACRRAEVPAVGTAVWRQMSSAIINTHFDAADRSCLVIAQDEPAADEVDEDGRDQEAATLISMSNHSLQTHRNAYANANPFANIWDGKLVRSYHASRVWAQFFGLGDRSSASAGSALGKRPHSRTAQEQVDARKVLRLGRDRAKRYWSTAALLFEARRLYQNAQLQWRCPEQEQAMRLVANRAPEVLLVLATGSGKSLMFMLGSSLPDARTTIVVVPLVLLRVDLLRRCRAMGLQPVVWRSGFDIAQNLAETPTLLFVSVEVASHHVFRQHARRLYDLGRLDRFIIDECHLIHTSAHYRPKMRQLCELRQFPVPFIYMTATLPPRLEEAFFRQHHIGAASIVRGRSNRCNLRYNVRFLDPEPDTSFVVSACDYIRTRWTRGDPSRWEQPRVMVFVRTQALAEEVASHLGCSYYHSGIGALSEKEACLQGWISGTSGSPFLACTTAAGPGVDYAHVRWVVHVGVPYGLMDYSQESGRAGRDGSEAGATIILPFNAPIIGPALDHPDPADAAALEEYLDSRVCRRLCLARELDRSPHWLVCDPAEGDILCDICEWPASPPTPADATVSSGQTTEAAAAHGMTRQRREHLRQQYELDTYLYHLEQVRGRCMICRLLAPDTDWAHPLRECVRPAVRRYFACKKEVMQRRGAWMPAYTACFRCAQPQSICTAGWQDRQTSSPECVYSDLVLPAIWGLWESGGADRAWLHQQLEEQVAHGSDALRRAGYGVEWGGIRCILGVQIYARLLQRWSGQETALFEAPP